MLEKFKTNVGSFRFYLLMLTLIAAACVVGYRVGYFISVESMMALQRAEQSVANLKEDNNRLTRQLNILGVELEVNRLAAQRAEQEIETGLRREAALREDLNFYQKVMAPELKQDGFVIDAFDIEAALSQQHYRFDLVLMQQAKIKNVVKGDLRVELSGSINGKPHTVSLKDILMEDGPNLAFGFKYFQVIQGEFVLPEGFVPEFVTVKAEVFQFRKKRGDLERRFVWQVKDSGTKPEQAL